MKAVRPHTVAREHLTGVTMNKLIIGSLLLVAYTSAQANCWITVSQGLTVTQCDDGSYSQTFRGSDGYQVTDGYDAEGDRGWTSSAVPGGAGTLYQYRDDSGNGYDGAGYQVGDDYNYNFVDSGGSVTNDTVTIIYQ